MYRIMIVKSKRDNYASLYQYLTTTVTDEETGEEQAVIAEFADETALYNQVEKMLNDDGSPKRISSLSSVSIIRLTPAATPTARIIKRTTHDVGEYKHEW